MEKSEINTYMPTYVLNHLVNKIIKTTTIAVCQLMFGILRSRSVSILYFFSILMWVIDSIHCEDCNDEARVPPYVINLLIITVMKH